MARTMMKYTTETCRKLNIYQFINQNWDNVNGDYVSALQGAPCVLDMANPLSEKILQVIKKTTGRC